MSDFANSKRTNLLITLLVLIILVSGNFFHSVKANAASSCSATVEDLKNKLQNIKFEIPGFAKITKSVLQNFLRNPAYNLERNFAIVFDDHLKELCYSFDIFDEPYILENFGLPNTAKIGRNELDSMKKKLENDISPSFLDIFSLPKVKHVLQVDKKILLETIDRYDNFDFPPEYAEIKELFNQLIGLKRKISRGISWENDSTVASGLKWSVFNTYFENYKNLFTKIMALENKNDSDRLKNILFGHHLNVLRFFMRSRSSMSLPYLKGLTTTTDVEFPDIPLEEKQNFKSFLLENYKDDPSTLEYLEKELPKVEWLN